jgi:membrane associated rhomboid family serine protease
VQREKITNLPGAVVVLVLTFLAIHGLRIYGLSIDWDNWVFQNFAYVGARMTAAFDPDAITTALANLASGKDPDQLEIARYLLGDGGLQPWTLLTYGFLHADWLHVGMNSAWLVAFGAPVAQRLGALRFLMLFLFGTAIGALAHYVLHPIEFVPLIGASAGVSALMGAACRFIFQPGGQLAGAPFGGAGGWYEGDPMQVPAVTVAEARKNARLLQFVAIWFVINLVFGVLAVPLGLSDSGIAWDAHIGGFIAGFFCFRWFDIKGNSIRDPMG